MDPAARDGELGLEVLNSPQRLIRYIDDFLLVTDNYDVARRFVNTMSRGFPEYGTYITPSKTLLSFEMAHCGQAAPVVIMRGDGAACELNDQASL